MYYLKKNFWTQLSSHSGNMGSILNIQKYLSDLIAKNVLHLIS